MSAIKWDKVSLICGNHADGRERILELKEGVPGTQPFYTCPECKNHFLTKDMEKLILKLDQLTSDENSPYRINITGYRWTEKGIAYNVLLQDKSGMKISVLNHKAIAR